MRFFVKQNEGEVLHETMEVRVEYEATPIRHIAVQCPRCSKWYHGQDITENELRFEHDIYFAQFHCPVCDHVFGADEYQKYANVHITECGYPEVYKDCLQKKEVWE